MTPFSCAPNLVSFLLMENCVYFGFHSSGLEPHLLSLRETSPGKFEMEHATTHQFECLGFDGDTVQSEGVKLVNICPDDIWNGKTKLILGMIWTIIYQFQVSRMSIDGKKNAKEAGGDRFSRANSLGFARSANHWSFGLFFFAPLSSSGLGVAATRCFAPEQRIARTRVARLLGAAAVWLP
jgi:hypothetical protein